MGVHKLLLAKAGSRLDSAHRLWFVDWPTCFHIVFVSSCHSGGVVVTECLPPAWPPGLKCLLSGPLQRKCADLCFRIFFSEALRLAVSVFGSLGVCLFLILVAFEGCIPGQQPQLPAFHGGRCFDEMLPLAVGLLLRFFSLCFWCFEVSS